MILSHLSLINGVRHLTGCGGALYSLMMRTEMKGLECAMTFTDKVYDEIRLLLHLISICYTHLTTPLHTYMTAQINLA